MSPARPVHRDSLCARLKNQGLFMRGLKERKFIKFTLTAHKDGRLMQSRESAGMGGWSTEEAHGLGVDEGQTLVPCKRDAAV